MFIPNEIPLSQNTISKLEAFLKRQQDWSFNEEPEGFFLISKEKHFDDFCQEFRGMAAINGGQLSTVSIMKLIRQFFNGGKTVPLADAKRLSETFFYEWGHHGQLTALENLYAAVFKLAYGD
jgi:hypothetical protein